MVGKHYCDRHIELEKTYGKRPTPERKVSTQWHDLYNSVRWRKSRADFLSAFPYCVICGEKATVVDHIEPHRGNEQIFFNPDNWQPLCTAHHNAKTLRENNYFKKSR